MRAVPFVNDAINKASLKLIEENPCVNLSAFDSSTAFSRSSSSTISAHNFVSKLKNKQRFSKRANKRKNEFFEPSFGCKTISMQSGLHPESSLS